MSEPSKTDYKAELKQFYAAKAGQPVVVHVPKMNFIMIDGNGDPNTSEEYAAAIQTLYPVAYAVKFISKLRFGRDFGVMPLEGLWWTEDMTEFSTDNKQDWLWTAMIMQPDVVTDDIYDQAVQQVKEKKSPEALGRLRFASYHEGRAAQALWVGPYSDEGPAIRELHEFISEQGGTLAATNKHHHEIYLGDPRRTAPAKLKTIIRQPF
jgi:hypothetical protein